MGTFENETPLSSFIPTVLQYLAFSSKKYILALYNRNTIRILYKHNPRLHMWLELHFV